MRISDQGIEFIKRWEGLELVAYKPLAHDVWTIGYGHTGPDVHENLVINEERAEQLLRMDLEFFEAGIRRAVEVPLKQHEFDALVSFVFNIGLAAFSRSTLLKHLNAGDYWSAAEEFRRWKFSGGQVVRGLVRRRAGEKLLFRDGEYM